MPAERANGRSAMNAMQTVPINEARQVARRTAVLSMPVAERIFGFTASMYAIVINVVIPAAISVFTFVPRSFSSNIFSSIYYTSFRKFCYVREIAIELAVVETVAYNKVIGDSEE